MGLEVNYFFMPILRWNTDYRATATLGATRTLLQPLFGSSQTTSFHKFYTCTSLGSSLSQILTITILHGAQIREIRHQLKRIYLIQFRRSSIDDINELRKKAYFRVTWKLNRADFVSMMEKASTVYLVVDGLIATVTFAAGITMPGGFIGIEGSHQGSAILTRNTAFRAFVITDTIAMVQSCSAAFISLFMPLLFHEKNPGGFSFLLAVMAFCLTIFAMGATVLAFVTGTYAVLMHSLDLAIATCVIGLCFFIPALFISIRCSYYVKKWLSRLFF